MFFILSELSLESTASFIFLSELVLGLQPSLISESSPTNCVDRFMRAEEQENSFMDDFLSIMPVHGLRVG